MRGADYIRRRKIPPAIVASALAAIVLASGSSAKTKAVDEVRALWVARTTLKSPASITRMVQAARDGGFNALLVQIRARGDAYYLGGREPRAAALAGEPSAFDPLQQTLNEAHRAGLGVHAWICVNLVSSAVDLPSSRSHIVNRHPEWLMVPRDIAVELSRMRPDSRPYLEALARSARRESGGVEGLFLSPIDPGAVDYLSAVVEDIVGRYPVDGVHFDYIRYPTDEFDCSKRSLALFASDVERTLSRPDARRMRSRAASSPLAYIDAFPERWREFRRLRLTALVEQLHAVVKHRRSAALVSAAVIPNPDDASGRHLQDWRLWAAKGALDVVCPMAYATDEDVFSEQVEVAREAAGQRPLWAGIGAYRLSASQTIENIRIARRAGADGIILFSYDSLVGSSADPDALARIGRAVFGRP